ncbi:MAG: AI-2E family transporter [Oscillospiraceae bacterium]|nr:AI-2E family transporter [Oscillospiraceae bacterium]
MKVIIDDKQKAIAKTAILVFTVCLLIVFVVWRWSAISEVIQKIISVLSPILIGLGLAYLLSPLSNWIENKLKLLTDKKKERPGLRRGLSVGLSMLILLAIVASLIASVVPELISSAKNLLNSLPEYLSSATTWINLHISSLKEAQPQMYSILMSVWDTAQNSLNNLADQFEPKLDSIASGGADIINIVTSSAISLFKWITNIFLGTIMAIYLLFKKEHYQAQARKFLYALLPREHVSGLLRIGSHCSYNFMHFLSGKTLDSFIIGLLCFTGMTILRMPYTTLISILIGVTNIIPFFGPIIGCVPSALLILLSEPRKMIPFIIYILVLQQFDGNILGPKILGDTLGLPMFWILFSITIGGGMFGFFGMVAFVPLFAAVYTLFSDFLDTRLQKKGLPHETGCYMSNDLPDELSETAPPEESASAPEETSADMDSAAPVPTQSDDAAKTESHEET